MSRFTEKKNDRYVYDDIYFGKFIDKLGQLEDIEEELGTDLITLFKALKNGFYYKEYFRNIKTKKTEEIIHYNNYAYFYYVNDYDTYVISTINQNFYLNRYGKDWALTEEELECHK